MNGHDAFGISKSLKPRHLEAMERYQQKYFDSGGQVGDFERARSITARKFKQESGRKAGKYPEYARGPLVEGGKRNKAELDKIEAKRRRSYRKNTRMGLFRTEVSSMSKSFTKLKPKLTHALDEKGLGSNMQDRMRGNYVIGRLSDGLKVDQGRPFRHTSMKAIENMNRRKGRQLP